MSQHLNSQQIMECLIGAGHSDEQRHARECSACRAEMESIAKPLAWFRASVQHAGARAMDDAFRTAPVLITSSSLHNPWWNFSGQGTRAGATSILIHASVVALLFLLGTNKTVQQIVVQQVELIAPDIAPYKPAVKKDAMHGGGGGGDRSPTPVSKGKLPKLADKQFVPPMVKPPDNPKLVMDPTLIIQPDANIPTVNMNQLGDPLAKSGLASNGFGSGGGMGTGRGGGVGPGLGPGFGPGSGGNMGGGAYKIGGGVSAPSILYKVEPEYSEEARKAKFQGTVLLFVVVDEHGNPRDIKIIRPLGLGLDEKAVEAVEKWKFNPGKKDGKPVAVQAQIEVNFRLL
jgi:periplasmic protein TonB